MGRFVSDRANTSNASLRRREIISMNAIAASAIATALRVPGQWVIVKPRDFMYSRSTCSRPVPITCHTRVSVAASIISRVPTDPPMSTTTSTPSNWGATGRA